MQELKYYSKKIQLLDIVGNIDGVTGGGDLVTTNKSTDPLDV